jgi:nucleoside 2-deoxyribosyltransferase
MAKSETKEKCFIIMPITTPSELVEQYKGDAAHFNHVLEHLFIPALENAGFEPVSPKSTGSDVIHAEIIKQLSSCELVLCDMSIFNPNVFFELGIRTALDKPVALVIDEKTMPIPFDTSILNFHTYGSLEVHTLEQEKQALTKHVQAAYKKSKDHNALWKYFGVAQTGTFKPEDIELGEKVDLIMTKLSAIELQQKKLEVGSIPSSVGGLIRQPFIEQELQKEIDQVQEDYRMKINRLAAAKAISEANIRASQKSKVERDESQGADSDNR